MHPIFLFYPGLKYERRSEETGSLIVVKTLTDITKYPDYVDRLTLIGIGQEPTIDSKRIEYYWLNAKILEN